MTESMGERIRRLRKAAGWRQGDLAWRGGLSITTMGKLERSEADPRTQTVQLLATALGCSVPYLLCGPRGFWNWLLGRWPVLEPAKKAGAEDKGETETEEGQDNAD